MYKRQVLVGSHIDYAFTYGIHTGDINFATIENGTIPNSNKYQGVLDQLLIYDRLLTDTEVNTINDQRASLGVIDDVFNSKISTHPNPVNNILNINLPTETALQSVAIFDVLGKKILVSDTTIIDFSTIPHGVYVLKIESKNGKTATKKIIKQ